MLRELDIFFVPGYDEENVPNGNPHRALSIYGNKTDKIDLQNGPGIIYNCVEFMVVFQTQKLPPYKFCKGT